ncbi:MAG: PepSY domain-containing protein [Lentisphaerales bacterium]|nr:PepSY domain-containing protein [Lentisphaerales bacterium]
MTWVYWPQDNQTATIVRYQTKGELHPNGNNYIFLNPVSGEISKAVYADKVPFVMRALNQVYPLHIGKVGISIFRLLIFLSGLFPIFMLYTAYKYNRLKSN